MIVALWTLIITGGIVGVVGFIGLLDGISQEWDEIAFAGLLKLVVGCIVLGCSIFILINCECVSTQYCTCGYSYMHDDKISYCPGCGATLE